jgi:hypothetical protein
MSLVYLRVQRLVMMRVLVTAILKQVKKYPTPLPLIASPSDGHPIKQQQFST